MTFLEYQKRAHATSQYSPIFVGDDATVPSHYIYPTLGLVGEAGEVAEKIKKVVRNKNGIMMKSDIEEIVLELGDVMWYIAELCTIFNIDLTKVAANNLKKLADRAKRNVIKSQGDNR